MTMKTGRSADYKLIEARLSAGPGSNRFASADITALVVEIELYEHLEKPFIIFLKVLINPLITLLNLIN